MKHDVVKYVKSCPISQVTGKLSWVPCVIQSDQVSNLTSHMVKQILKQLGFKHNCASAYDVQSQATVEQFHQTLKSMPRTYVMEMGRDWEVGLPWLMLVARGVVQESTEFRWRGKFGLLKQIIKHCTIAMLSSISLAQVIRG